MPKTQVSNRPYAYALIGVTLLISVAWMNQDRIQPVTMGTLAPDFEVRDLDDGDTEEFVLAFGDMINFESSEISMASPIGKALLGHIVGDVVEISFPGGLLRYEVVSFLTLHQFGGTKQIG